MSIYGLIILSIGLSMDAFAVSVCKGISLKKDSIKNSSIIALYLGAFQALMPVIGYFLGISFSEKIISIDHWIALILLSTIGINMIKEALSNETETLSSSINFKEMIVLGVATSIDALAVGITFAFLKVNLIFAITLIGLVTFILTFIGTKIGRKFGNKYEKKAEIVGGIILIALGIKIVLEHLNIL